jgi:streptogramin lyase
MTGRAALTICTELPRTGVIAVLAAIAALVLAGCGGSGSSGGRTMPAAFAGRVDGGGPQNPISGAGVTLYAMAASGYGTGASSLATATTGSDGSFSFGSYTCPAGNPQTYVTATGGNAGSGSNSAIGLMSLTGPCNSLSSSTFVTLNELATVAAEFALAQFSDSTGTDFGTSSTNATGLNNAVNLAESDLVVSYLASGGNPANTGIPASFLPWSSGSSTCTASQNCDGLERIDTLANILASCINTGGPSSTQCSTLLSGTGSGTTTLAAAHYIAAHPASNVSTIYGISPPPELTLFAPALSSAPGDWTLALNFNPSGAGFNGPQNLAIDASGDAWVGNVSGDSVTELSPSGGLAGNFNNSNTAGAGFSAPYDVAIDISGNVWIPNNSGDSLTELTSAGALVANFNNTNTSSADFLGPTAVALDNFGTIWITNFGSMTRFLYGSSPVTNFNPSGANFLDLLGLAVDPGGFAWGTNEENNSVTELDSNGNLLGNFTDSNASGANFGGPVGVAIDASRNVWITNETGSSLTELEAGCSTSRCFASNFNNTNTTGANFYGPYALAIDGMGNVWTANQGGDSVTELDSSGGLVGNFAPAGANLNGPNGIVIDASGDVWVANNFGNSVTEIIGAAVPVLTPLQACLTQTPGKAVCLP